MAKIVLTVCDRCRQARPPYHDGIGGSFCLACFPIVQQVPDVKFGWDGYPTRKVSLREALRICRREAGVFGMAPEFVEALPSAIAENPDRLRGICSILHKGLWTGNKIDETATRLGMHMILGYVQFGNGIGSSGPAGMVEADLACQIENALEYKERVAAQVEANHRTRIAHQEVEF